MARLLIATVIPTPLLLSSETDSNNFVEMRVSQYLELRAGDQPRRPCRRHLPGLPPVVVVLADDLQDVARVEGDPGLGTGDQVVIQRVVLELGSHEDVAWRRCRAIRGNNLGRGQ